MMVAQKAKPLTKFAYHCTHGHTMSSFDELTRCPARVGGHPCEGTLIPGLPAGVRLDGTR